LDLNTALAAIRALTVGLCEARRSRDFALRAKRGQCLRTVTTVWLRKQHMSVPPPFDSANDYGLATNALPS